MSIFRNLIFKDQFEQPAIYTVTARFKGIRCEGGFLKTVSVPSTNTTKPLFY